MAKHATKRKGSDFLKQMGFEDSSNTYTYVHEDDDLEAELAVLIGNDVACRMSSSNKQKHMAAQLLQDVDEMVSDTEHPELMAELAHSTEGTEPAHGPQAHSTEGTEPAQESPAPKVLQSAEYSMDESDMTMARKEHETESADKDWEIPPEPTEEETQKLFCAPAAPRTVMEALTQRLQKYTSAGDSARQAGDSRRARMMARIVKQYEDAVKTFKAGKPVNFTHLPTPPGYGSIPVDSSTPKQKPPSLRSRNTSPHTAAAITTTAAAARLSPSPEDQAQAVLQRSGGDDGDAASGETVKDTTAQEGGTSKPEYQLKFLRDNLEEFRKAALNAKKNGDLDLAKNHIRTIKGIEQLINAAQGGQPVDLSQVPPLPLDSGQKDKYMMDSGQEDKHMMDSGQDKHIMVIADNNTPAGSRDDLFTQLNQDLLNQMRMCATNSQHFTKVGDVTAASRFQKLEQTCRKDLEMLKSAWKHGDPVPKFHYETRNFSLIQSNTDLGDGEMELTVVRGICLSLLPGYIEKDMDTAVCYEFSFPADSPQTGQTSAVKSTVNPEYHESFRLQIDRKARSFLRFVEQKGIKLNIYIKRGFLKGDKLLGSAVVKLSPLNTKCTLHDSFDLADGRKSVGGKLEVKVRVREPFKGQQVKESQEKWLVIDQFVHVFSPTAKVAVEQSKSSKSRFCTLF